MTKISDAQVRPIPEERRTVHDQETLDRDGVEVYICHGAEGDSIVMNDRRVCGPKAWGGGSVGKQWKASKADILAALGLEIARPPDPDDTGEIARLETAPPGARITVDENVCHGATVFAGTRIPVAQIVAAIGAGDSVARIVEAYGVTAADVFAGISLAAEMLDAAGGCSPEDVRQALAVPEDDEGEA